MTNSLNIPFVQRFDEGLDPVLEVLGGKGASLVTMTDAGMPVPPGFVVTTASFDEFIREAGVAEHIDKFLNDLDAEDIKEVDRVSAIIRDELCSLEVPENARFAVHQAYRDLMERCGGDVPVAVRSSATAEDLPDASFAGQQDTYLWQVGLSAVTEHIRKCWASLFTSRAIIYRLKNNIPNEGLSMAVVVQKMVKSRVAGVAITMNPSNGDRSKITIDSSWGVGEMVVSGEVTPDNILLDKITLQVVSEHIGSKHAELIPDATSGSLVEKPVDEERANRRSLTDEEMLAVAQMAKRAEKHYKCPQDIEWALDADLPDGENLLLLQSRPETIHSNGVKKETPTPQAAKTTGTFDFSSITVAMTGTK
ncbi:PEP/pyruvate-binding domain-containing protein [Corynebacterium glutamicum]|uniref:PEP/pyruvate-binding domain-containing protein n=1 Tax=Corynebacterium glutamicum TaxID=1718 RepID=UPI00058A5768|nr:PEP/pyruvate-binding domain-containing protein [Corynebacterium glutamicum]AJE66595.1 phosphoenolpyruvate synthase [Corynebacterium glutamicum]OKX91124.1 phosphoenolpyruvate synthase [Corynebacterium glutamicum]TWS33281.1 phosphoenolpyruvate synthase [Corynebacterium glutamicum]